MTETKPWELAKDEANAEQLDQVLYDLSDGLRVAAIALFAVPPRDGAEDPRPRSVSRRSSAGSRSPTGSSSPATAIEAAPPLFPRIELPDADAAYRRK